MIDVPHPDEMSPDEILSEVASLLAKGYWRHRRCEADVAQHLDTAQNSSSLTKRNDWTFPGHRSPNGDAVNRC